MHLWVSQAVPPQKNSSSNSIGNNKKRVVQYILVCIRIQFYQFQNKRIHTLVSFKEMQIFVSHERFRFLGHFFLPMILPQNFHKEKFSRLKFPDLTIYNRHQSLLIAQMTIQLNQNLQENMRWIQKMFLQHRDMEDGMNVL